MKQRFLVMFEKGETGYSAYSPDVPGCLAVGHTLEEVRRRYSEILQLHIDNLAEDGLPLPVARYVSSDLIEAEVPVQIANATT